MVGVVAEEEVVEEAAEVVAKEVVEEDQRQSIHRMMNQAQLVDDEDHKAKTKKEKQK